MQLVDISFFFPLFFCGYFAIFSEIKKVIHLALDKRINM